MSGVSELHGHVVDGKTIRAICSHVRARLKQHRENLALWQNGVLTPTEPCEEERVAVMRELKACIYELEGVEKLLGGSDSTEDTAHTE